MFPRNVYAKGEIIIASPVNFRGQKYVFFHFFSDNCRDLQDWMKKTQKDTRQKTSLILCEDMLGMKQNLTAFFLGYL